MGHIFIHSCFLEEEKTVKHKHYSRHLCFFSKAFYLLERFQSFYAEKFACLHGICRDFSDYDSYNQVIKKRLQLEPITRFYNM